MIVRNLSRVVLAGLIGLGVTNLARAAEGEPPAVPAQEWSFDGPFGTYDRAELQRGYQVYKEVCSACHSLSLLAYRDLTDIGLTDDQVKGLIKDITVTDGPNDAGEMFERPAKLSDRFKKPFPNDEAARAGNNGALPPDLSLIVKARAIEPTGLIPVLRSFLVKLQPTGADYVYGVLTGFRELDKVTPEQRKEWGVPADFKLGNGMNFNIHFKNFQIAMPPPLSDGQVTFADGSPDKVQDMARDVVTFLSWAAEPKMEQRKRTGVKVIMFLLVLAGMMYLVKRKVWSKVAH